MLDLAKVVDVLVLAVHCEADWESSMFDEDADMLISCLKAVGMPEVVCALQGMESLPPKKYKDIKRDVGRNIEDTLVPEIKSFEIPVVQDPAASPAAAMDVASLDFSTKPVPTSIGRDGTAQMIRGLSGMTARNMQWRSIRSYLLSEGAEAVTAPEGYSEGAQAIKLKGFLRGRPMCVNHLMHVLGGGTARVVSISSTQSPFEHSRRPGSGANDGEEVEVEGEEAAVYANSAEQDQLALEAVPDGLMGEQTWPSEAEMAAAEAVSFAETNVLGQTAAGGDRSQGRDRRRTNAPVSVPVGMSDYQADWFIDEDGNFDNPEAVSDALGVRGKEEQEDRVVGGSIIDGDDGDDMTLGGSVMDEPDARAFDVEEKKTLARRRAEEVRGAVLET